MYAHCVGGRAAFAGLVRIQSTAEIASLIKEREMLTGEIFLPLLFPRLIHRLEEIAMNCIAQTVGGSPDAALQNRLICESRLQQVA